MEFLTLQPAAQAAERLRASADQLHRAIDSLRRGRPVQNARAIAESMAQDLNFTLTLLPEQPKKPRRQRRAA